MPSRKITGLPKAKKGDKFLLIKESKRSRFIVEKLAKRRKK